jgi:hypothetical protein
MAKMNVKTEVNGPDEIKINFVREDYFETSNTFCIFFGICFALTGTIFVTIISALNEHMNLKVDSPLTIGALLDDRTSVMKIHDRLLSGRPAGPQAGFNRHIFGEKRNKTQFRGLRITQPTWIPMICQEKPTTEF